jgi:quinol monooxygenase YgiN
VTVVARWWDADSYDKLRNSPEFGAAMAQFAEEFTGSPRVSINEIIVEM